MATITQKSKTAEQPFWQKLVSFITPAIAFFLLFFLAVSAPDLNRSNLRIVTFLLMWVALASSWNLIGGYTGYTDFGHTVFVGIGGYTAGILMARLGFLSGAGSIADQRLINWEFAPVLPVAFVIGAIFALIVGYPTLRLKGPYFAIAMLGTYVAMREITRSDIDIIRIPQADGSFILEGLTNGGKGISFLAPFANVNDIFYVMLGLAGLTFFVSLLIYRAQIGKMLKAVRDDEIGADMRGINTTLIKIGIFMLAGGMTAMVGATKAYWDGYIDPDQIFPDAYTIEIIMMTLLGGIGRPWGPVIGAVLFYYGRTVIWANAGEQHLLITGTLLAVIVLFMPKGILGLLDPEDRGLVWFIRNRILGQKDLIFDDSDDFQFQAVQQQATNQASAYSLEQKIGDNVVLEGRGLVKKFGGLTAVDDVDFKVYEGEIVGLLGPNGSGKTTLFNCVSGTLPTTDGQVLLDGNDITGFPPWRINRTGLARTFQRIRIYRNQTVYDNMLLARKWVGVPPWAWLWIAPPSVRQKANELLVFLKMDHVRNNLGSNLSGGQQRLLEIGMSLMSDPRIVLLDEATSGVNPALVEEIKESLIRLNREQGVTFFLIEHNMNFAMSLCNRLYVLDYGAKIAEGSPEEIQENERVVEAYFGRDE